MPLTMAELVAAVYPKRVLLRLYDVHIVTMSLKRAVGRSTSFTSVAWNWDDRTVVAATRPSREYRGPVRASDGEGRGA